MIRALAGFRPSLPALALPLLLAGCYEGPNGPSFVPPPDLSRNVVTFHLSSQPDGLHPFNNNSGDRTIIFTYTQKSLVRIDLGSLKTFPALVESMPVVSEDQLFYSYRIKPGIYWDNGEELTARDVAFTAKIQVCPLTDNAAVRPIYDTVIDDIILDEDDPYAFQMKAKKVYATNAEIFSEIYLQQQSHWDPEGVLDRYTFADFYEPDFKAKAGQDLVDWMKDFNSADNSYKPENLVGLGPYQVTAWETDAYIELTRKENWWGEDDTSRYNANYPEKIVFRIIKDGAAAKMSLKNQKVDVTTRLGNSALLKLQELDYFNEAFDSEFVPEYAYAYVGLNMRPHESGRTPFFEDVRVRRALAYATPVDEIIEVLLYGNGMRQTSNVSPLKPAYDTTLTPIPFDLEKAAELLTEAGWVDTDGDNIRDKEINGRRVPFRFDLNYFGNSQLSKETALMMREEYYKVGVDINTVPLDFTILYKSAYEHNFDAMFGVWGGSGSYSDPVQLWHTSSWVNKGSNFPGFGDAVSDSLIDRCNSIVDSEERIPVYRALQKKIYDDQPYIFLYSRVRPTIIHKRFENRQMYSEKPGLFTNNLKLRPEFGGNLLTPEAL
jgi:peptide/nickel transport system substrate-binding protein